MLLHILTDLVPNSFFSVPACVHPLRRVVLCTGKVYYDLHARREELGLDKGQVRRVRAGAETRSEEHGSMEGSQH